MAAELCAYCKRPTELVRFPGSPSAALDLDGTEHRCTERGPRPGDPDWLDQVPLQQRRGALALYQMKLRGMAGRQRRRNRTRPESLNTRIKPKS